MCPHEKVKLCTCVAELIDHPVEYGISHSLFLIGVINLRTFKISTAVCRVFGRNEAHTKQSEDLFIS